MNHYPTVFARAAIVSATAFAIAGCATPPPRPSGAIVPMAGGQYRSAVKSADIERALRTFTNDAEITCGKPPAGNMPWDKFTPGKYEVISQTTKDKDGKEIKSDNKMLDAGIAVGLRRLGLESQDAVEVNTIFKCK
jgi:hypothetical protein